MKSLEARAKAKYGDDPNEYAAQRDGYTNGAIDERKRIVELIESQIDLLDAEVESGCLSKIGDLNNQIRINILIRILTKINEYEK